MKKIIKLEFIKTLNYPGFKTIIILHAALYLLVVFIGSRIQLNFQGARLDKLVSFPNVWGTLAWVGSWFNLLLGILFAILVGNEHQFRTFRKQIMDGVSRNQLLYAKITVMSVIALYALLLVFLSGLIFGFIYTSNYSLGSIFNNMPLILVLYIQAFAYMMLGMLIGFIFRTNALSIIMFILFFFPGEPILRAFFPDQIDRFFPIKIISNLTPMPDFLGIATSDMIQVNGSSPLSLQKMGLLQDSLSMGSSILVCLTYIILFYLATKLIVEKRNF